jgi:hypothetical protein
MRRLKLNLNGETRLFQADGNVAVIVRGAPVIRGTWQSLSTTANLLHYHLDNIEQPPVPVRHSFNEYNQLVTVIPGLNGGPDSEPCVWLGRIEVDDAHDIGYVLFDDDGTEFSQRLLVRGQLRFAAETADLLIDLAGGGVATITGEKGLDGLSRLSAGQSLVADFDARDLLTFTARTRNDLAKRPSRLPVRAKIQFTGHWDIQEETGGLVFRSRVAGSTDRPEVAIAFAGQLKAVTVGFAWYADPQGARLALTIAGRHRWNAREAGFELTLGNSERRFLADFKGELIRRGEVGHQFVLNGEVALRYHEKTGPILAIGIEGEYQIDSQGRLIFRAQADTAGSYDLQLEGRLVYREGTLSFLMRVGRQNQSPTVQMQIAYQKNREELQTMLAALLLVEKDKVRFELNFEVRMQFKGGVLVRDKPHRLPG